MVTQLINLTKFFISPLGITITSLAGIAGVIMPLCILCIDRVTANSRARKLERVITPKSIERAARVNVVQLARGPQVGVSLNQKTIHTVRFGITPYIDHTQAFIAQRLAWFEEVGIRITFHQYAAHDAIAALERGEIDVVSSTPSALIKRGANPQSIQAFVLHDLFMGYGLMTRRNWFYLPPTQVKSYGALRQEEKTHSEALQIIAEYIHKRRVAHAPDDAIFPFLSRLTASINGPDPFRHVIASEVDTVKAVVTGHADFQVGGVPSRLTLENLGLKTLVSSRELLESGPLFNNSAEYLTMIQCGWFARKAWLKQNHDLALRLASISYRISKYIVDDPVVSARIQVDFLNDIAETKLNAGDIARAYKDFHPFKTFEDQESWFENPSDPHFVNTVTQNIINYWKKIYPRSSFLNLNKTSDVIVAEHFHKELKILQDNCAQIFRSIHGSPSIPPEALLSEALLRAAAKYMASYNYLDCLQILKGVQKISRDPPIAG